MGSFQSGQMGQAVNLLSFDFGGSNPSPPTHFFHNSHNFLVAEVAQLIEHQPSKLRVASLSLVFRSKRQPLRLSFFLCPRRNSLRSFSDQRIFTVVIDKIYRSTASARLIYG